MLIFGLISLDIAKTDILQHLHTFDWSWIRFLSLQSKKEVKNLGVILDCDLSFKSHINQVTKTCFYHLRNIARIRPILSFNDAKKLIHAFIFSRLNYCNAVYTGLPKGSIVKLQLIQNAEARVLMKLKKREHITPVLM